MGSATLLKFRNRARQLLVRNHIYYERNARETRDIFIMHSEALFYKFYLYQLFFQVCL